MGRVGAGRGSYAGAVGGDRAVPVFIEPMLLGTVRGALPTAGWALEPKFDGCRAQLRAVDGVVAVRTRHGRDVTAAFPELVALVDALPARVVLDGELVCIDPDDGLPDFERLRPRLAMSRASAIAAAAAARPARLIVFDVLHLGAASTCPLPYRSRRELLLQLELRGPSWETTLATSASDPALIAGTERLGLEGVVAKRLDARYLPGRRAPAAALKFKHRRRSRLILSGWRPATEGRPEAFYLRWRDGSPGGEISRAISPAAAAELRRAAAAATSSVTRTGIHNVEIGAVLLDVDHHGREGRPVRDPSIAAPGQVLAG